MVTTDSLLKLLSPQSFVGEVGHRRLHHRLRHPSEMVPWIRMTIPPPDRSIRPQRPMTSSSTRDVGKRLRQRRERAGIHRSRPRDCRFNAAHARRRRVDGERKGQCDEELGCGGDGVGHGSHEEHRLRFAQGQRREAGSRASGPHAPDGDRRRISRRPLVQEIARSVQTAPAPRVARDLAASGATLIRGEVRLARLELAQAVEAIGRATVLVAAAAVWGLLGSLSLIVALVLLAGEQWIPRMYWLAAFVLMVITGALAAFFASRGRTLLAPSRNAGSWIKR